jgi:hypothetical protein
MKRSNEVTLKEALRSWLHESHLDEKINERRLKERWPALFGKTIHQYTKNIQLRQGKLFLLVESAALRQELQYHQQKMIERINAEIAPGLVREIVLR